VLLKDYGGKKAGLHPFGPLVSDVWTDLNRIKHAKNRDEHPCQLPETILERLILMTTDEGDIALDPFNGTGTTVIAAKRLGRKYIGIELDKKYVTIAEEKLIHVQADSHIDGIWMSKYLNVIATIRDKDWDALREHFYIPHPIPLLECENIVYKNGKLIKHRHIHRDAEKILMLPFGDVNSHQKLSAKSAQN
jgi:site-specific DNA-methyltransferase (adenine-specific)